MTWPLVALGELCEINVGRTPSRDNPSFWGQGEPWLSIADMSQGQVIRHTKEQITPVAAKAGKLIDPGTVLLSFKLSIGKVAIAGLPLYSNEAIAALPIRDSGRLIPQYLLRALEAMDLSSTANRAAMGATLNKASLQQLRVPVPPLADQHRIAAILDHADALRAKRRGVLAHLNDLVQSIYLDMFGNETTHVQFNSVVSSMRNGLSPSKGGGVTATVLTLSAVTQGGFDPSATKESTFRDVPGPNMRVTADDFLVCRGNGNLGLVGAGVHPPQDRPDLVFPDTVIAARMDKTKIDPAYLETAWRQPGVRQQIQASARTTNGTHKINQESLSSIELLLPPLADQHQFARRVAAIPRPGLTELDELFASLQSHAFAGQL